MIQGHLVYTCVVILIFNLSPYPAWLSPNSPGILFQLQSAVTVLYPFLFVGLIYLPPVCSYRLFQATNRDGVSSVSYLYCLDIHLPSPTSSPARIVRHPALLSDGVHPFRRCILNGI